MIKIIVKRKKSLRQRVKDLELIVKKQAQEIELLNARVGDKPLQVEVISSDSEEAKKLAEEEENIKKINIAYEELIEQL